MFVWLLILTASTGITLMTNILVLMFYNDIMPSQADFKLFLLLYFVGVGKVATSPANVPLVAAVAVEVIVTSNAIGVVEWVT